MSASDTIQLGEGDDGRVLETRAGQAIELRLPENPTAGYRWRVVQDAAPVCELVTQTFEAGRKPGQPGIHVRQYRVAASGKATLKLVYRRSWDSEDSAARTFSIRVNNSTGPMPA